MIAIAIIIENHGLDHGSPALTQNSECIAALFNIFQYYTKSDDINSRIINYIATPMHSHPYCVKIEAVEYYPKMNTLRVQLTTLRLHIKEPLIKEFILSISPLFNSWGATTGDAIISSIVMTLIRIKYYYTTK